jgi:two-component system chemotaxis response regulator CheY
MAEYSCLIVEDSPMMRQLLVFALARLKNLRVTEADDGVDGLRKLASTKYDVIITDINMPIMDGLKLVKRVRSDPVHKDTPIIIITTEGSQEDRQRALQLGANAYITKPIQAPQVIAKVKEFARLARSGVWIGSAIRSSSERSSQVNVVGRFARQAERMWG